MDKYLQLYSHIDDIKEYKPNRYMGTCPFPEHDDSEPSFSVNMENGQYKCFGCNESGNAITFSKHFGYDWKEFYDVQPNGVSIYQQRAKENCNRLEKKDIPPCWDIELCKQQGVGIFNNTITYSLLDYDSNFIGLKFHKRNPKGIKNTWYLEHLLRDYSRDVALYIAEGEKDAITLLSHRFQVISSIAGANAYPQDLSLFKEWKSKILICYDNDDAGKQGSHKLKQAILTKYPYLSVS